MVRGTGSPERDTLKFWWRETAKEDNPDDGIRENFMNKLQVLRIADLYLYEIY